MKITNIHGLSETLVRAVEKRTRAEASDGYSPSMLTNSPRQVWLTRRHWHELSEDVSDRIWALLGDGVHYILREGAGEQDLSEELIETTVLGKRFAGKSDLFSGGEISDWKVTSVWTVIFGDRIKDWEQQLNCYAYLYGTLGFPVKSLWVIALLRDWERNKAETQDNYPRKNVVAIPLPLWPTEKQREHIESRISLFETFRDTPDVDLPWCSPEERWEKRTTYAVMKNGRKSALRVFDSREAAQTYLLEKGGDRIDERCGEAVRCAYYCPVAPLCSQRQAELYADKLVSVDSDG